MNILVLSDLHFEFYKGKGIFEFIEDLPEADVCILAGDVTNNLEYKKNITNVLSLFCSRFNHVLFVAGNHEFYGSTRERVYEELNAIKASNFHFLNRTSIEIDGQRFLGTTLWFPDTADARLRRNFLNDFRYIRDFDSWVYEENHNDQEFLRREMCKGDVVITHHLPSEQSVHSTYKGDPYNCYFVCEMSQLILDKQPAICGHGHTHFTADYHINKTRVVCNPFGYKGIEENREFKKDLIINI